VIVGNQHGRADRRDLRQDDLRAPQQYVFRRILLDQLGEGMFELPDAALRDVGAPNDGLLRIG
jgi:hypothetical protein